MKIRQIPTRQFGSIHDGDSLSLSQELQLLFAYVDADTSAVRDSIRYFFFGENGDRALEFDKSELELAFESGSTIGSRFGDGVRLRNVELQSEWDETLREIDYSTYRAFFDTNFGRGDLAGPQLCYQLHHRFNVPYGEVGRLADSQEELKRESEIKQEIGEINRDLSACRREKEQLHQRLEELEGHQVGPYEFELSQKRALEGRVSKLREGLSELRARACRLEEAIQQAAVPTVPKRIFFPSTNRADTVSKANQHLADQLHDIDAQIERWKAVKTDVDGRLTTMQGDLSAARVSEFDNMFDDIRSTVRTSEERLLSLLDQIETGNQRSVELEALVELNHQLCDGLNSLQDYWRDEVFRGEIESLRRCSSELDGYLGRLAGKRNSLAQQPPHQKSNGRCICHTHGCEQAGDRHRVEELNRQHAEVLKEIEVSEKLLIKANREWQTLEDRPDLNQELGLVRQRIDACNQDYGLLQDRKDQLLNSLRELMEQQHQNSQLVQLISEYASRLTGGRISGIYLHERGHDIHLLDSSQMVIAYEQADFVTRNKIRMAISLGCAQLLHEAGYTLPLVWEDAFIGFQTADLDSALPVLKRFSENHGQVILLTNNLFVRNYFEEQDIPSSDLPDRYSGESQPVVPRESGRTYRTVTDWSRVNRQFDVAAMDQYGTASTQEYSELAFTSDAQKTVENRPAVSRANRQREVNSIKKEPSSRVQPAASDGRKFYLEVSSRVEAAPTIGPKTAEKLEKIGICTVADLIEHEASWIAEQLENRRIKNEDVISWQQQALLVCQVPNLRGHDAQLLVACGICDAVQLAGMNPDDLYAVIGPFAKSKDGKKLLRGSTEPDLKEVRNWVHWARDQREIKIAA